jgi:hypothetical protein
MEQHTAKPSPTSNADSSALEQPANQSAASSAGRLDGRAPGDVIERIDTGALDDMAFLRARGCRCPLIAKGGLGVPFTGCNETGDRAVCAKRLIATHEA